MDSATRVRISSAALLVKVIAQIWYGRTPDSINAAIRQVITRVFPLPGPANTNKGPSLWKTASFCESVSVSVGITEVKHTSIHKYFI